MKKLLKMASVMFAMYGTASVPAMADGNKISEVFSEQKANLKEGCEEVNPMSNAAPIIHSPAQAEAPNIPFQLVANVNDDYQYIGSKVLSGLLSEEKPLMSAVFYLIPCIKNFLAQIGA